MGDKHNYNLCRIDVYQDILSTRQQRFRELIERSISQKISTKEKKELEELQLWRNVVTHVKEQGLVEDLNIAINKLEEINQEISKINKE